MPIMNDAWILTQCVPPTHRTQNDELAWTGLTHDPADLDREVRHGRAELITPEMQAELDWQPMIVPFETELVRRISKPLSEDEKFRHYNGDKVEGVSDQSGDLVRETKVISFGVSSYGYDVRLAEEFKIFTNANGGVIDPKRFEEESLLTDGKIREDDNGDKYVILPPNSYLLGRTTEFFRTPRDIMVVCVGKSTYARAGAIVNVTPIEAGFEGHVVIEVSNSTTLPLKIYANEGIAQFLFFEGNAPCMTSYADRGGKYMGQTGITHAKV